MEDHFALIAHLEIGDTITVINGIPYRQSHHRWWTSCTRYYYGSDRHHTMKWIEEVLQGELLSGYRIPLIRGLRNLSHTYQNDQLIHHRIITVITDILHRYPINPSDIIQLLELPSPAVVTPHYDLITLIIKYGFRYLPLSGLSGGISLLPW